MRADPPNYRATVNGPDALGRIRSMQEENQMLIVRVNFQWVDPPPDTQTIPSKYKYKWKYNEAEVAVQQNSRIV